MTLLKLVDDIFDELNDKNHSMYIFIDLSKAFDTTNHKLLIKKPFSLWRKRHRFWTGSSAIYKMENNI